MASRRIALCAAFIAVSMSAGCKKPKPPPTIRLLRVTRDMEPGDEIGENDIEVIAFPAQFEGTVRNVVAEDRLDLVIGREVRQPTAKGQWLFWYHLTREPDGLEWFLPPGYVAFPIHVDPGKAPTDILRPNQVVDILGAVSVGGQPPRFYRIISSVRVLSIDGWAVGSPPPRHGRARQPRPEPRTQPADGKEAIGPPCVISVQLPEVVALELANVLTHLVGDARVVLRPMDDALPPRQRRINRELSTLAVKVKTPDAKTQ